MNPDRRREDERLNQLYEDMYIGRDADNPPVTLRLDRLEGWMQRVRENSSRGFWLLVATFLTVLGNLILNYLKH